MAFNYKQSKGSILQTLACGHTAHALLQTEEGQEGLPDHVWGAVGFSGVKGLT